MARLSPVRWSISVLVITWASLAFGGQSAPRASQAGDARSAHGIVVSGSALASHVGARVLEAGGNAVDAAVATAFALAVTEPSMSGIGGRTQILIRSSAGTYHGIDGATQVPRGGAVKPRFAHGNAYGYGTVAVPGTVAALGRALAEHGTWSLARALEPAIALARDGFPLPAAEAARIASAADLLREFPGSRRYFLRPSGRAYAAGDRFVQSDLARTLQQLAERGVADFYRGDIARRLVRDIRDAGGTVTREDLEGYEARDAHVVRGEYRGHELAATYLPASGATTIEVLQVMQHFELGPIVGEADWVATIARALRIGFADRSTGSGSPERRAQRLTSKEWAATRASDVRLARPAVNAATVAALDAVEALESANTTHVSVVDAHGAAVALTQSLGPNMGAIAAADGLGFLYAATMGYLDGDRPGARPLSSQSPLIVADGDKPVFVMGGAGAQRIIPAIVTVLSRAIDGGAPLADAMRAPRFHARASSLEMEVRPGTAWPGKVLDRLRAGGFRVQVKHDAPYFGRVNGIAYAPATGDYVGVADPRWPGSAAAVPRVPACAAPVLVLARSAALGSSGAVAAASTPSCFSGSQK